MHESTFSLSNAGILLSGVRWRAGKRNAVQKVGYMWERVACLEYHTVVCLEYHFPLSHIEGSMKRLSFEFLKFPLAKNLGILEKKKKKKTRKRKNIDQVTGDAVMWPVRLPGSWPCLALVPQSSCPGYPGLCGSSCSPLLHTPPRGWVTA